MSIVQTILEDLSDYLVEQDDFYKNKQFWFDPLQITPSCTLPCFCYQVINMGEDTENCLDPEYREYSKIVDIMCLTDTTDSSKLINELWEFEENLITTLRRARPSNISPNLAELEFTQSSGLDSFWDFDPEMRKKSSKEVQAKEFCNALYCTYKMKYIIPPKERW